MPFCRTYAQAIAQPLAVARCFGKVPRLSVAVCGDDRIVCLVEVEHDRAKLGGCADFSEFAARVTSVYEKVGGNWQLVHRHADPITSARPAESMLGQPKAPQ